MKMRFLCLAGLMLAAMAGQVHASAVIQFDSLEVAGSGATFFSSYSEAGFEITSPSNNFASWQTGHGNYAGSGALFNNSGNRNTVLTKSGGGNFTLNSIDLSEVRSSATAANVTFTGNVSGGGTVSQSIDLDQVFGFETLVFSGFTNLVSVEWLQTANYHQFDNITLNSAAGVPEPASIAMWSLMGGIGLVVRRRRKMTA